MAPVDMDGSVYVEDSFIGTLEGFELKEADFPDDSKEIRAAADQILAQKIHDRVEELVAAEDGELSLILGDPMTRSTINWRGIIVARVVRGQTILTPKAVVIPTPLLQHDSLARVQSRVDRWLENHIGEILSPLFALQEAVNGALGADGQVMIDGMARGIAFQMVEKLGTIPRRQIARDFRSVTSQGRFQLKQLGIWLGAASLYIPSLLKPAPAQLRLFLWALFTGQDQLPEKPVAGLCTITIDPKAPRPFYEVCGYRVVGRNAVRLDMLERLANAAREISLKGPFPATPDLMSLVGSSGADFVEIMACLGYVYQQYSAEEAARIAAASSPEPVGKPEENSAGKQSASAEGKPPVAIEEKSPVAAEQQPQSSVEEKPPVSVEEKSSVSAEQQPQGPVEQQPKVTTEQQPEVMTEERPTVTTDQQLQVSDEQQPVIAAADQPVVVAEPEKIFLFRHQPYQKPVRTKKTGGKRRPAREKSAKDHKDRPRDKASKKPRRKPDVIDPHNPFAALAGLKNQLKTKK